MHTDKSDDLGLSAQTKKSKKIEIERVEHPFQQFEIVGFNKMMRSCYRLFPN